MARWSATTTWTDARMIARQDARGAVGSAPARSLAGFRNGRFGPLYLTAVSRSGTPKAGSPAIAERSGRGETGKMVSDVQ